MDEEGEEGRRMGAVGDTCEGSNREEAGRHDARRADAARCPAARPTRRDPTRAQFSIIVSDGVREERGGVKGHSMDYHVLHSYFTPFLSLSLVSVSF